MNSRNIAMSFFASAAILAVAVTGVGPASAASSSSSCSVTTIRSGSSGSLVTTWQTRLNIPVTGSFDAHTISATKRWQGMKKLVVDGIVGPLTWASLGGFPGCGAAVAPTRVEPVSTTQYVAHNNDHSARFHAAPSTSSEVTGYASAGAAVTGVVTGYWMRTSKGYINTSTMVQGAGIKGYNGKMPAHYLCNVPKELNSTGVFDPGYSPSTQRVFGCGAIEPLRAMNEAYKRAFGMNLAIDLTYRTYAEQQYWYTKLGPRLAAYPGSSNHGWAASIDLWENSASPYRFGTKGQSWLQANASRYGFTSTGRPSQEYWHYNFEG